MGYFNLEICRMKLFVIVYIRKHGQHKGKTEFWVGFTAGFGLLHGGTGTRRRILLYWQ